MSLVVGPVLPLLRSVGLHGPSLVLASAFYSRGPLEWLAKEATADEVTFLGRLNLRDLKRGSVDPAALLAFSRAIMDRGGRIRILVSPRAHAKMYVGDRGVIVGSANLSTRGFGAGPEIVNLLGADVIERALAAVDGYSRGFQVLELNQLQVYVKRYRREIQRARRQRENEDVLPAARMSIRISGPHVVRGSRGSRAARLRRRVASLVGDYGDFLRWAARQPSGAAHETVARARGKGQLSGHIHRNFYGLRQLLLAAPDLLARFATEDADTYKLSRDRVTERRIARFVAQNATDESDFVLDIWKTYLPRECGGRAGKHGGTIGNLNRMLPLVARYLTRRMSAV